MHTWVRSIIVAVVMAVGAVLALTAPAEAAQEDPLVASARQLVQDGTLVLHSNAAGDLRWDQATTHTMDGLTYVHAPAAKFEGDISSLTVFFTEDESHAHYVEIFIASADTAPTDMGVWQDGTAVDPAPDAVLYSSSWWDRFKACLSEYAGLSGTAMATIAAACMFFCAGTAGIGCIVCASATGSVGSGTMGHCAAVADAG
ncbi:hypothetical protein AB0K52_25560 [Glycomyces sp. NPDC049804]|uniref:hypothetical protein n=1 Tax=Glycomyces sp. NPDC049804 TaxID=3154363 RepID=UPI0034431C32